MSNEFYSLMINQFLVTPHPDQSVSIVMSGIAVDTETPEGGDFELKVNGQPVHTRVRRDRRNQGARLAKQAPEITHAGFTLRADLPNVNVKKVELTYNGRGKKVFEGQALEKATNTTGLMSMIDVYLYQKKKDLLIIQGWLIGTNSSEPFEITLLDAHGNEVKDAKVRFSARFDVSRSFFTLTERVSGFHIYVNNPARFDKPFSMKVSNGQQEWIVPIVQPKLSWLNLKGINAQRISHGVEYLRIHGLKPFLSRLHFKATHKDSPFNDEYNRWFLAHRATPEQLEAQRRVKFDWNPKVSLIVAAYNTPLDLLEKMIDSVREQTYDNWQLCIADGSSTNDVEDYLKAHPDPKISWCRLEKNLGISGNMNAAADLADGELISLYDHDDFLEPDCLFEVVKAFNEHDYDFVYTDEDKFEDATGRYVGPNFKPDFSPALLRSTNYICHFLTMKKSVYDAAGGTLKSEYDGAQDFDLVLRLMDICKPEKIGHLPRILYHWRMHAGSTALDSESKLWAYTAGERALKDWATRNGMDVEVLDTDVHGQYHLKYPTPGNPLVSVIIPNKDHINDLNVCLDNLIRRSTYKNFEVIVVENNSTEQKTFEGYEDIKRTYPDKVQIIEWQHPFNYSAINNFGVKHAKGEYLLFLNNDTEAINGDLLQELLGQAVLPGVGAVGAKLYYEDGTIQHNGVIIGHSGVAGHAMIGQVEGGENYRLRTMTNVSAATAACLMVPRHVFEEIGGFNEDLAVAYNDIDLCLRIRKAGHQIIQNPFAIMFHYESQTRGYEDDEKKKARFENEVRRMYHLWPDELRSEDPYYNPNLDLTSITYQLRTDDEVNPYINPDFLGEDYYTCGTLRPERPEPKNEDETKASSEKK
ncbi:glycosyltransferase family 2 protein [uncultured Allobaculum sp.]|uniref:glycosyltransferase family 2 protein n=1 Tax=uncultured Allobaculum sp. TaxID=1187017 RepID=UPI0026253062|nr:glycosyltransferase family 2 protein [uncultured Allobaculum sp.]